MDISPEKISELEALLFVHGEPLSREKTAKILDITKEALGTLLDELDKRLLMEDRGLALLRDGEKLQLVTKAQFGSIVERFVKEELSEDLTPASLEALSLISYLGPVSRSRLDYIRGVNSLFILRSLLLRGLIERFPDPERPNSFLYRPSFDTMRHLGIRAQEELPEYEKFKSLLEQFETKTAVAAEEAASSQNAAVDATTQDTS